MAAPSGRIWFSMARGLSVADPRLADVLAPPAIVNIESISLDGKPVDNMESLTVPAAYKRITFGYASTSLAAPERVNYRFKLDGFDHAWSSPVTTREAVYTNLTPGDYRFHVMASSSDGLWNGAETTFGFKVEPALWQTWWFRTTSLLAVALAAIALYRFRLHTVTQQLNLRFDERLSERTRIARDLHDTLLQGVLSASMHLHVANDLLADDSPAKPLITRVIDLMGQVTTEGRDAVRGLRSSDAETDDLELAFSRVQKQIAVSDSTKFRIIVEGEVTHIHPVIRDEVYRIGREALTNAFRHSQASEVELELEYLSNGLRLLVRDNGQGLPAELREGRDGHWGLVGMNERAKGIGSKLRVWSREGSGTEVELTVPGQIAFDTSRQSKKWNIISFGKRTKSQKSRTKAN